MQQISEAARAKFWVVQLFLQRLQHLLLELRLRQKAKRKVDLQDLQHLDLQDLQHFGLQHLLQKVEGEGLAQALLPQHFQHLQLEHVGEVAEAGEGAPPPERGPRSIDISEPQERSASEKKCLNCHLSLFIKSSWFSKDCQGPPETCVSDSVSLNISWLSKDCQVPPVFKCGQLKVQIDVIL